MAKSVAARLHGDDYQALVFWEQASRLLRGLDDIEAIDIESDDLKSIDDVVLHFKEGHIDNHGKPLRKECYQVKYHVDFRNSLRAESLIDPSFINATSVSFLQRAFNVWKRYCDEGVSIVFFSPWGIDSKDALRTLVSGEDGCICIEDLSNAGVRTKIGSTLELWRKHLSADRETVLCFLESLHIVTAEQKGRLLEHVSNSLTLAGLSPISSDELINPYLALSRTLIEGRQHTHLTREQVTSLCQQSHLWQGPPINLGPAKKIGVRSRFRGTEGFEQWTENRLDLLNKFDGRLLKSGLNWDSDIFDPLNAFLQSQLKLGECCEMWMPVHATIAMAIGYILDSKQGADVRVLQTMVSGTEIWKNSLPQGVAGMCSGWETSDQVMDNGNDIAIAISVTHDILEDVQTYMRDEGLKISILRHFLHPKHGKQAISTQEEAIILAEKVVESVRQLKRTAIKRESARTSILHLFAAMPNFMTFALGQRLRPLGCVQLYEHNLESGDGADYMPSLQLPPMKG